MPLLSLQQQQPGQIWLLLRAAAGCSFLQAQVLHPESVAEMRPRQKNQELLAMQQKEDRQAAAHEQHREKAQEVQEIEMPR